MSEVAETQVWSPRNIDDALLVPFADQLMIFRVIAFTEDRRAVVTTVGSGIKVEDEPGCWAKVGRFVKRTVNDWWWGSTTSYVFEPLP